MRSYTIVLYRTRIIPKYCASQLFLAYTVLIGFRCCRTISFFGIVSVALRSAEWAAFSLHWLIQSMRAAFKQPLQQPFSLMRARARTHTHLDASLRLFGEIQLEPLQRKWQRLFRGCFVFFFYRLVCIGEMRASAIMKPAGFKSSHYSKRKQHRGKPIRKWLLCALTPVNQSFIRSAFLHNNGLGLHSHRISLLSVAPIEYALVVIECQYGWQMAFRSHSHSRRAPNCFAGTMNG